MRPTYAKRQFTKDWWLAATMNAEDFTGAACASTDHAHERDIWTLDYGMRNPTGTRRQKERAIEVCRSECPVLLKCAKYSLCHPDLVGIWGGMDEEQRARLRDTHGAHART